MLIDKYLVEWDFAKQNDVDVRIQSPPMISFLYDVDCGKSRLIRILFFLRGLPKRMFSIKGILDLGFILLEEDQSEIVIGLVAQPWKLNGNIVKITTEQFMAFMGQDYVKVVWNFKTEKNLEGQVNISTETRIQCTSSKARRIFSIYWFFIGFFSGVIRREMLNIIKKELIKSTRTLSVTAN
jgi:hypothetical protein